MEGSRFISGSNDAYSPPFLMTISIFSRPVEIIKD